MPRAALLSIHARVEGTKPSSWADPSLAQLWGPRFNAYVVPARDFAIFSLGRLPDDPRRRGFAEDLAQRLDKFLAGRQMKHSDAARGLGEKDHNRLRYAATTGTVRILWDGARQPTIWTVPRPDVEPREARLELARRYLHVFGPTTPEGFVTWAGIRGRAAGTAAFEALGSSLTPVRTPIGDAWILASDEEVFRAEARVADGVRLLPSGDTYFLLQGADREMLVPDADRRRELWTPRVWPGAVLAGGELVGTWRRAETVFTVQPWRRLVAMVREAIEAEASSLPIPGISRKIALRWEWPGFPVAGQPGLEIWFVVIVEMVEKLSRGETLLLERDDAKDSTSLVHYLDLNVFRKVLSRR
jgi:hypothetical protein